MEGADGDNNNNNNGNYYNANDNGVDMYRSYYIGPTCGQDGKTINLGVFLDAGCSSKANSGVYEAFNYGKSLPYEFESIVDTDECLSCMQVDDDNGKCTTTNIVYSIPVAVFLTGFPFFTALQTTTTTTITTTTTATTTTTRTRTTK
jgi:hypothetical protein